MSLVHNLYLGHFEREGDFVRLSRTPANPLLTPVISRPLDMAVVEELLREKGLYASDIPDEWELYLEDGYIVCARRHPEAVDFLIRLARRTGCDIFDLACFALLKPEDVICHRAVGEGASAEP